MVKFLGFALGELGSTTEKVDIVAVDGQVIGFNLHSYRFSSCLNPFHQKYEHRLQLITSDAMWSAPD